MATMPWRVMRRVRGCLNVIGGSAYSVSFVDNAGSVFESARHAAGRRGRCKRCGGVTTIPHAAPEAAPTTFSPATVPENVIRPTRPARKLKRRLPNLEPWLSLMLGMGLAVVALSVPLIGMVPAALHTVVHELGHVGTDWLTGGASVPGFDLANGGGFFRGFGRLTALLVVIYAVFACVVYRVRNRPQLLVICIIIIVAHVNAHPGLVCARSLAHNMVPPEQISLAWRAAFAEFLRPGEE